MLKRMLLLLITALMGLCILQTASAQVGVHGFVLARTIAADGNYTARIERYGIQFAEKLDDEFNWLAEIYIHPQLTSAAGRLYMESAYLNWNLKNRVPWDFSVRIGKGRNECYGIAPYYSSRRTSDYSLYSCAFTQLRVVGFQTFSNFGENIKLSVALVNPYVLASRQHPDFAVGNFVNIPICDRDNDNSTIKRVGVSGRLGYKTGPLNVGASAYMSETGPGDNNEQNRYGVDGEVKLESGLMGQVQFTQATTNGIDHNGGEVLVGFEQKKYGLYARYGMLTYDSDDTATYYDLDQIMVSAVYKIRPRIQFRLEGLINGEENEIDNNVLFFETLFAW